MTHELAEHISVLAAPIFAALLGQVRMQMPAGTAIPAEALQEMRDQALTQAHALWLNTLDRTL